MKLIEILAAGMSKWPHDFDGLPALAVSQDSDGTITVFDSRSNGEPSTTQFLPNGDWSREFWTGGAIRVLNIADDHATAIVTAEQWAGCVLQED